MMTTYPNALFLLTVLSVATLIASTTAAQPAKQARRIVFFGDSITQQGETPGGYLTLLRKTLKDNAAADTQVEIIGAGISGHKVPDLQKRLDPDVLAADPTDVVIYIGINDVWHSQKGKGTPVDLFDSGLRDLVQKITESGSNVILCTPSVIGEKHDGSNPLDTMLNEYSDITRKIAEDTGTQLIDLRNLFIEHLQDNNPKNKDKGVLTRDGVHLNQRGNEFVADQMEKALELSIPDEAEESTNAAEAPLRHVVLFHFKDDVDQPSRQEIVDQFGNLKEKIDTIIDYEFGTDISTENLSQGFTHCFVVTFADAAGRDSYLPHPAHQAFVKLLDGKIEKVLVLDFISQ